MKLIIAGSIALCACVGEAPPVQQGAVDAAPTEDSSGGADAAIDSGPTTMFSFFITSTGGPLGGDFRANAADLDGLAGADAFCTAKAVAAVPAAATRTWRAYLSTATVDARDRIGTGPWYNVNLVQVATSVANLHDAAANQLNGTNSIDENGVAIGNNQHDILTGSLADGTKAPNHCNNWTSSAETGVTTNVGHHNRMGGGADPTSWGAAHASSGCSAAAFISTGGRGSIYCFAL